MTKPYMTFEELPDGTQRATFYAANTPTADGSTTLVMNGITRDGANALLATLLAIYGQGLKDGQRSLAQLVAGTVEPFRA